MDVWLNSIITIQALLTFIHLTTLYHLQPLRVMPAKLFTLNFLSPFFIIFLLKTSTQLLLCNLIKELPWHKDNNTFISWEENWWGGFIWVRENIKNICSELFYAINKNQLNILLKKSGLPIANGNGKN